MVVGHEIGHIVNRDSIKTFKRSMIWSILNAVLTSKSQTAGDITGIGLGLLSLRYSRLDEYDADDSGVSLSYLRATIHIRGWRSSTGRRPGWRGAGQARGRSTS